MARHWIVRIGVKRPQYRTATGATARDAVSDAVGDRLLNNHYFCKPMLLRDLRVQRKLQAAVDDPTGWVGFENVRGMMYKEVHIDDVLKASLHIEACDDGYYCQSCESNAGMTYTADHAMMKCELCGAVTVSNRKMKAY